MKREKIVKYLFVHASSSERITVSKWKSEEFLGNVTKIQHMKRS